MKKMENISAENMSIQVEQASRCPGGKKDGTEWVIIKIGKTGRPEKEMVSYVCNAKRARKLAQAITAAADEAEARLKENSNGRLQL